MLLKTQFKILQRALSNLTGVYLKISTSQIRRVVQTGSSFFGSLKKFAPMSIILMPLAKEAITPLSSSVLHSLGSFGMGNGWVKQVVFW